MDLADKPMPEQKFGQLRQYLQAHIIGQQHLIDSLLIALLSGGHLLLEGAPGLAKTKAIKLLASSIHADFHRIQFTPDLLPADVTGSEIYRPQTSEFVFQKGPVFHNLVLADEINRAPAKVQSALLEAMAEGQVSVGQQSYQLPELFMVLATQNPLEQEGTYPLPEAQLDRFMLHVEIDYPDAACELAILRLVRREDFSSGQQLDFGIGIADVLAARQQLADIYLAEELEQYLVQLILATRDMGRFGADAQNWLAYGASPRATLALDRSARARAWLAGRDYVDLADVQIQFPDVIRHRIGVDFNAEAMGVSKQQVIDLILNETASI